MSSARTTKYLPDTVSPPGDTLLEAISMRGLSQAQLGERASRFRPRFFVTATDEKVDRNGLDRRMLR